MKNIKLTLLFFGLFFQLIVYSQSGKIIKIKDGDTVVILDSLNNQITIRLAEVDCPESSQPFGKQAKKFTADEVGMKNVTYQIISKDRYNRTIAKVFYNGKYLSKEIIRNGFGWHYKQYSTSKELSDIEIISRKNKLGLWKDKNAVEPWEFRKNKIPVFRVGRH
jgi:endonuclease YncB( thermonuclease family)